MDGLFGEDDTPCTDESKKLKSTSKPKTEDIHSDTHWPFAGLTPINTISQQTKAIAAETHDGPVEYKWTLANATEDRIHHLSTQMQWRLSEGNGHALYRLGIEDDGTVSGMEPQDFKKTIENFNEIVKLSNAEKVKTYQHIIKPKPVPKVEKVFGQGRNGPKGSKGLRTKPRFCADIHIRKNNDELLSNIEKKFIIVGPAQAGKSTLIGVLSQGMLDDGNGSARLTTFKHKHEIETGRTSTASAFDIFGFSETGQVLDYSTLEDPEEMCKRSKYLATLVDVAGMEKYKKTLLHGLEFTNPDGGIIVIQKNQINDHLEEYRDLLERCGVKLAAVVVTEIRLAHLSGRNFSPKRQKSVPVDVDGLDVPVVNCDCVTGKGLDELRREIFQIFEEDSEKTVDVDDKNEETIFKVEETYQITDVGTVVTGYLKLGAIQENDILTLGPVEFGENLENPTLSPEDNTMRTDASSSPCTVMSKKSRKRKRNSLSKNGGNSSSGDENPNSPEINLTLNSNSATTLNKYGCIQVRVISVHRHRIRCCKALENQLCSLCIEPVNNNNHENIDYVINRGAVIYKSENLKYTDKLVVRLKNPNHEIKLKRRTRMNGFYDTACFDANVKRFKTVEQCQNQSNLKVNNENQSEPQQILTIDLQLEKFMLVRIGDSCLLSCLRSIGDVVQAEIVSIDF
jgi:GTPase